MMMTAQPHIPTCYASCSIGTKPEHDLPAKLEAISSAGFEAIELSLPDLVSFANSYLKKQISNYDYPELCEAGAKVKELCQTNNLKVLILQPFSNFEGWPDGSPEKEDAWKRAKGWLQIMEAVGTDMLQVSYQLVLPMDKNLGAPGHCRIAKTQLGLNNNDSKIGRLVRYSQH